ncbi:MAG TPA: hypothetical protein VJL80_05830 [Aeromicrobium sp.]|nr:hypothetical protein [Aeromicrobium sp.]HKY57538.1 hypothetical protein [Aeromicrobium sp.]
MALDYFTLAEFRALPDMNDSSMWSDARVTAIGEYIQGVIEGECQTSFVARSTTETLDGSGTTRLLLKTPYVLSITSATINGTAVTDTMSVSRGVVERVVAGTYNPMTWTLGRRNVTIVYSAGYSTTPPSDIKEAALQGARAYALETSEKSGTLARRSSVTNDLGGTTSYVLAGEEQPTGYPQVDAVIVRWKRKLNKVTYP